MRGNKSKYHCGLCKCTDFLSRQKIMNQLISMVKRHPELYNSQHVDFKDQQKKNSLWTLMALELGLENGFTAKNKWRNLKDSYVKYLRNGTKGKDKRYKNWPWAEQMEFLKPTLVSRCPELAGGSSVNNESPSEEEGSMEIQVTDEGPSNSKRRKNGKSYTSSFSHFDNGINDYFLQDTDADDLLFLSYSKTLKTFSRKRQMLVKMEISKIMLEAEMLQATEDEQLEMKLEPENLDDEEDDEEVIDVEPEQSFLYLNEVDKYEETKRE